MLQASTKSTLSVEQTQQICRACEDVVLQFTAHFDSGEYSKMDPLFATHGVWKRQDGDINGLAHFKAWSKGRTTSTFVRHVLSNLRTIALDAGNATVDSYVTVYRHDFTGEPVLPAPFTGPALMGRYHDMVIHEEGQWKLAHREVKVDFKRTV